LSKRIGETILKHIQVKATRSDRLKDGRIRHMRVKEKPTTAAHRIPNCRINESTELSFAT
jgi:hypothetical protein